MSSVSVKTQPVRPIVVNDEYVMPEPDVLLMKEVEERYNVENQFLKIDKEFNERLYEYAVKQQDRSET